MTAKSNDNLSMSKFIYISTLYAAKNVLIYKNMLFYKLKYARAAATSATVRLNYRHRRVFVK